MCAVHAQDATAIKRDYTKYEYRIAMRDGAKLFTAVYVPKALGKTSPILLTRTPYSVRPYGEDKYRDNLGPSEHFSKAGYVFVYQDVRGRFMSEGVFEHIRPHKAVKSGPKDIDESTDTWDTLDWLINNISANNGKAGIWGISYPGFYTSTGMIDAHPSLKAVSPQAPVGDWFIGDDFHHNGALYLVHALRWFSANSRKMDNPTTGPTTPQQVDYKTPDGYRYYLDMGPLANFDERELKGSVGFWNDMMKHGVYDDFWKARDIRRHMNAIKPAVLTVGGWFDAEDLFGTLETFRSVEAKGPLSENLLVMGPWYHGQWASASGDSLGAVKFDAKTAPYYQEKIEFPFFERYLRDKPSHGLPKASMFETGRNQWRQFDAWPPKGVQSKRLYLQANGGLAFTAPTLAGRDEYLSDPNKPVPYTGYIAQNMTREHMLDDQRFAATRPDVLEYRTELLEEDLTLAGPIDPRLFVSTSGTDSDFVVKVIDQFPDDLRENGGYEMLIRGEIFRGKFRNSFEKPEPFTPDKPEKIEYRMPDVFHTFRRGHRVVVQIQSTWFPLADRNPQKFMDIYSARREDFVKATQRVYFGGERPSSIAISVLP